MASVTWWFVLAVVAVLEVRRPDVWTLRALSALQPPAAAAPRAALALHDDGLHAVGLVAETRLAGVAVGVVVSHLYQDTAVS